MITKCLIIAKDKNYKVSQYLINAIIFNINYK